MSDYSRVQEAVSRLRLPIHPPNEAEVLLWISTLCERDQSMVRFLSTLQAKQYQVSIEELKIAGQTT